MFNLVHILLNRPVFVLYMNTCMQTYADNVKVKVYIFKYNSYKTTVGLYNGSEVYSRQKMSENLSNKNKRTGLLYSVYCILIITQGLITQNACGLFPLGLCSHF